MFFSKNKGSKQNVQESVKEDKKGQIISAYVMLPLSKPIIMVGAIFAVTAAWSDFLLPYLVLNGANDKTTVMVKLFSFKDTPTDSAASGAVKG